MDFTDFARMHGVLIKSEPAFGVWERHKTVDKPHKMNGSVKFMGDYGHVQNHATMDEVANWRSDKPIEVKYQNLAKASISNSTLTHEEVARKAAWMIGQAKVDYLDYFMLKGFPDHKVLTMERDGKKMGLLPMRVGNKLSSLQIIIWDKEERSWRKTFLKGGATKGATFTIGQGYPIFVEGMATGLSVEKALNKANIKARVVVCFSANNMLHVAKGVKDGLVFADNDVSKKGLQVAESIGLPYWISPVVGEDANDAHKRMGDFKWMMEVKSTCMMQQSSI